MSFERAGEIKYSTIVCRGRSTKKMTGEGGGGLHEYIVKREGIQEFWSTYYRVIRSTQ